MSEEPKWRYVERIAARLEQSLTPAAKVEHNKFLPVIGKPKREPRQCDVVITYGEAPRQSIAIVEVQDRNRRPEINTFHGWVKKMQEVGAQRLICVSALGYPQSIIDAVKTEYGPTVVLMTLEELQEARVDQLIFVAPYVIRTHPHVSFESTTQPAELENPPLHIDEFQLNGSAKVFSIGDNAERFSLIDLTNRLFESYIPRMLYQKRIPISKSYSIEFDLGSVGKESWLHLEKERYKILSLPIKLTVETRVTQVPLTVYAYHQESIDGVLAWIVSASGIAEGKEVAFEIVFRPGENGLLRIDSVQMQGTESVELILSSDESVIKQITGQD